MSYRPDQSKACLGGRKGRTGETCRLEASPLAAYEHTVPPGGDRQTAGDRPSFTRVCALLGCVPGTGGGSARYTGMTYTSRLPALAQVVFCGLV